MRLRCFYCGKSVSTEVPDETIVRACLECPECIESRPNPGIKAINDLYKEKYKLRRSQGASLKLVRRHYEECKEAIKNARLRA